MLGVAVMAAPGGCGTATQSKHAGVHGLGRGFIGGSSDIAMVLGADRSLGDEDARNDLRLSVRTHEPAYAGDAWADPSRPDLRNLRRGRFTTRHARGYLYFERDRHPSPSRWR